MKDATRGALNRAANEIYREGFLAGLRFGKQLEQQEGETDIEIETEPETRPASVKDAVARVLREAGRRLSLDEIDEIMNDPPGNNFRRKNVHDALNELRQAGLADNDFDRGWAETLRARRLRENEPALRARAEPEEGRQSVSVDEAVVRVLREARCRLRFDEIADMLLEFNKQRIFEALVALREKALATADSDGWAETSLARRIRRANEKEARDAARPHSLSSADDRPPMFRRSRQAQEDRLAGLDERREGSGRSRQDQDEQDELDRRTRNENGIA